MTRTLLERAHRLIKAATGEPYGDGDMVTDICIGYAEPGYGDNESIVVFGNWNDKTWKNPTRAERLSSRLFDALERIGVNCEWLDEWFSCCECQRAMRTQADSYSWTMFGSYCVDGYVCQDCMLEDVGAYLEDYINDSDKAITWATGKDLEAVGFEQWAPNDPQEYESGWYPGQTDDPKAILTEVQEAMPDSETVFLIDSVGQFDIRFSAYVRTDDDA